MDWKLEVVTIPVADVDRAKHFYSEQVGFVVDLDIQMTAETRLVQLTPTGSSCSIHLNSGLAMSPGSLQGLILVVSNVDTAHAELAARGVETSPVQHMDNGVWVDGRGGDWNSFVFFRDPDGNSWTLQERPAPHR